MSESTAQSPIYFYHGSPGTPADFDQVASFLPGRKIVKVRRLGYPESLHGVLQQYISEPALVVGYSWGSVTAILLAAAAPEVTGLVLVSPFLAPKRSPSGFLKFLLSKSFISRPLLSWKGKGAIAQFLVSSSAPHPVPPAYQSLHESLSDPSVLATSMLEKTDEATIGLISALRKINERNIPITIVFGDQDPPGSPNLHIERLKDSCPRARLAKIEGGGHALLWTHPNVVADEILKIVALGRS